METILSVHNLTKHFGRIQAVNQLFIEVNRGDVFGLLGPNGSGKSTTLGMVLDLVKPDSGTFQWFGHNPSKEDRKKIGSVIETPNFFPYLSAEQNLKIVADIKGLNYDDIPRVLHLVSLHDRRKSKFKTFSFGMRQRLAVASALLGHPDVMILDEPTNGLDPQGIAQMRELILQVAAEGITIILASHLLDEVQKVCSHVAVLSKGRKLYSGEVSKVLAVSDSIELSSADIPELVRVIVTHPDYKSHQQAEDLLLVYFKKEVDPASINQFCNQNGVLLSHLAERKRSLEQHFLELLHDNQ